MFLSRLSFAFPHSGYHSSEDELTAPPHDEGASKQQQRHQQQQQQRRRLKQIPQRAIETITATYEEVKINLANARDRRAR